MNPRGHQSRIPDVTLERYLLGELPGREMAETKRRIDEDDDSRSRLAALAQSNQEILERHPANLMARQIRLRVENQIERPSRWQFSRSWPVTAAMGTAIGLLVVSLVGPANFDLPWTGEETSVVRIKGDGPQLNLYRKTPDGSEDLEDGTRAYEGDIIQIGYQAAGRLYGVIVSVDGRGTATIHLPDGGDRSARLESGGQVLLDFALELDDAPRWERFYFITADTPFDVSPVLQAARRLDTQQPVDRLDTLDLPDGLDQVVVSLEKGDRR